MATNNYDAIECSQEETWGVPVMTTSKTQLEMILDGQAVIKSYIGTSQYQQGSSTSACGLASMNAVKAVLHAERDGCRGPDLVSNILSKELVAHAMQICSWWSSSAPLEIEDIYRFSWFSRALRLVHTEYTQSTADQFMRITKGLLSFATNVKSAAAIISKSPEILAVFAIVTDQPPPRPPIVFVVFDPHPRPLAHPFGAGFSFFGTAEETTGYLVSLLAVDLSLSGLQSQEQLLGTCSIHVFVVPDDPPTLSTMELETELFKADILALEARYALAQQKTELSELQALHQRKVEEMGNSLRALQSQLDCARQAISRAEGERDEALSFVKEGDKGKGPAGGPPPPPPPSLNSTCTNGYGGRSLPEPPSDVPNSTSSSFGLAPQSLTLSNRSSNLSLTQALSLGSAINPPKSVIACPAAESQHYAAELQRREDAAFRTG